MSWYKKPRFRKGESNFSESIKIEGDDYANLEFVDESHDVDIEGELRPVCLIKYLDGTAKSKDGSQAVKGQTYSLWIGKTLAIALSNLFGDPDMDDQPSLKGKRAKIFRTTRLFRGHRGYGAEAFRGLLDMQMAEPQFITTPLKVDMKRFVEPFLVTFNIIGQGGGMSKEQIETWFNNKYGAEHYPPVADIIQYLLDTLVADVKDGRLVRK